MTMHNPPPNAPLGKPPPPMTPADRARLKTYGLTEASYNEMVVACRNRCAACGRTPQQAYTGHTNRPSRLTPDKLRPSNLLCKGCKRSCTQYRKDWVTYNAEALWNHVQTRGMHHIICYMASDPGRSDIWRWMRRNRQWIEPPRDPNITLPAIPDEPPPPLPEDKHPTGQHRPPGTPLMDPAKRLPVRTTPTHRPSGRRLGPAYRGRGRPKQSDYIDTANDEGPLIIPDHGDGPVIGSIFGDIFGGIDDIPPPTADDPPNR